jgi:tetratricopeptide (TPR) repeat protein
VHADRSKAYANLGKWTEAENDLCSAIQQEPDYYWNYIDRGKLYLKQKKKQQALKDFDRAITINPQYFYAYVFRAGIFYEEGNYSLAKEDYSLVLQKKPDYVHAYLPIAVDYYIEGRWDEAYVYFQKSAEIDSDDIARRMLAILCLKWQKNQKSYQEALLQLSSSLKNDHPFYPMLRYMAEPSGTFYLLNCIQKEKNTIIKNRMLFYAAELQRMEGDLKTAFTYLMEVRDNLSPSLLEQKLAVHFLQSSNSNR